MNATDETALAIYQKHRGNHMICEALLDEFFAPADYTAVMEAVREAVTEGVSVMFEQIEIGHLTSGIRMNAADVCEAFWRTPNRRAEFGEREIRDIREAVLGLWTLLREIEKSEAA